jgi:hypothetical protein
MEQDTMKSLHNAILAAYTPFFSFMCRDRNVSWRDCADTFTTILQARRDWSKLLLEHDPSCSAIDIRLSVKTSESRVVYFDKNDEKARKTKVPYDTFVRMPWKEYEVILTNLITNRSLNNTRRYRWAQERKSWSFWERFWWLNKCAETLGVEMEQTTEVEVQNMLQGTNQINRAFLVFSILLYVLAHITMWALAFLAFRDQSQEVYTETWTSNLPNFG